MAPECQIILFELTILKIIKTKVSTKLYFTIAEKQKFRSFKYKKIFFLRAMAHECQMPAKTSFVKFTDHTESAKCYTLKLTFARAETCFYIRAVSHSERKLPQPHFYWGHFIQ